MAASEHAFDLLLCKKFTSFLCCYIECGGEKTKGDVKSVHKGLKDQHWIAEVKFRTGSGNIKIPKINSCVT